jgi:hypothetical protein
MKQPLVDQFDAQAEGKQRSYHRLVSDRKTLGGTPRMQRRIMERDGVGRPIPPNPIPDDGERLLGLMNEALEYAGYGVAQSEASEHGKHLYNRFKAHFDLVTSKELAVAHAGLASATRALKIATWWLAAITVVLGVIEIIKMWRGH